MKVGRPEITVADEIANKVRDDVYLDINYNRLKTLRKEYHTQGYKDDRENTLCWLIVFVLVIFIISFTVGALIGFGYGYSYGYNGAQYLFNISGYVP